MSDVTTEEITALKAEIAADRAKHRQAVQELFDRTVKQAAALERDADPMPVLAGIAMLDILAALYHVECVYDYEHGDAAKRLIGYWLETVGQNEGHPTISHRLRWVLQDSWAAERDNYPDLDLTDPLN